VNLRTTLLIAIACLATQVASVGAQDTWRVSAPVWSLGSEGSAVEFYRVGAVAFTSVGDAVVANAGTHEILLVSPEGRLRWRMGRRGRGPGEFESLDGVAVFSVDSIAIADGRLRRVTILSGSGRVLRTFDMPRLPAGTSITGLHPLPGNTFLLGTLRGRMPGDPAGAMRGRGALVHMSARGEMLDVVAELPGDEWFASRDNLMLGLLPFGKVTRYGVDDRRILIADGTLPGFREIITPSGIDRSRVVPAIRERIVSATDVRDHTAKVIRDAPAEGRQILASTFREIVFPRTFPFTRNLAVSREGSVWLQEYCSPAASETWWHVVHRDGNVVARVELPCAIRVLSVKDNEVVVLEVDDLGVESISKRLIRR